MWVNFGCVSVGVSVGVNEGNGFGHRYRCESGYECQWCQWCQCMCVDVAVYNFVRMNT